MPDDKSILLPQFEKLYWEVSRKMSYLWKEVFEQRFPGSQYYILLSLERKGPKKMSELAHSLNLTPGAVTTASDKLLKNGYLTRIRDENDRRVVILGITEKGRLAIAELQAKGRDAMASVFSHLSGADLESLIRIFEEAAKNIEKLREGKDK